MSIKINNSILKNTKLIYDYLNVPTEISKADIIVGLGCMDIGIPKECVKLYNKGYGKQIVFSGNVGKGTKNILNQTEAERFKEIAINAGISQDSILLEKEATNTYENYKFTKKLLKKHNIDFDSMIIVQKPYVKRRCIAIADVELPDKEFYVTSESLSFEEFVEQSEKNNTMSIEEIINEIVGEINIILITPKYGLESEQIVPDNILEAYNFLLRKGYNKHIISSQQIETVLNIWQEKGILTENISKSKLELKK